MKLETTNGLLIDGSVLGIPYRWRGAWNRFIGSLEESNIRITEKEDEIIWWEDLEEAVAKVKSQGYKVDLEIFEGSPHVGHMRLHPEQYWGKISTAWGEAQPTR